LFLVSESLKARVIKYINYLWDVVQNQIRNFTIESLFQELLLIHDQFLYDSQTTRDLIHECNCIHIILFNNLFNLLFSFAFIRILNVFHKLSQTAFKYFINLSKHTFHFAFIFLISHSFKNKVLTFRWINRVISIKHPFETILRSFL